MYADVLGVSVVFFLFFLCVFLICACTHSSGTGSWALMRNSIVGTAKRNPISFSGFIIKKILNKYFMLPFIVIEVESCVVFEKFNAKFRAKKISHD